MIIDSRISDVLFYEPLFLFVFFPLIYTVYLVLRHFTYGALGWIALASCAFYLWSEPVFFWIALASSVFDYVLGKRISRDGGQIWLTIGVVANLALLCIFKYSAFAIGEIANPGLAGIGAAQLSVPSLALPIGISFIVFEKITYLVDIRRGVSAPAESFPRYLFFVFFFPKLLGGPIIKYHELQPQLEQFPLKWTPVERRNCDQQIILEQFPLKWMPAGRRHCDRQTMLEPRFTRTPLSSALVALGIERFATGVVKKMLLADPAAAISDQVFALPASATGQIDAWIGALFFTAQIYFDFSAYSDMAIGLAMMLGFRLRENFNFPYTAIGITEFWRRWHISLSSWIREYLYIPLGGSRGPAWRTYLNLFVCFMASGIWHGAGWTFLAWGAFHGFFLVIEKAFAGRWLKALPELIGTALTFAVAVHGWVLFRASDFAQAGAMFAAMYSMDGRQTVYVPPQIGALVIASLLAASSARWWLPLVSRLWQTAPTQLAGQGVLVLLFALSLGRVLAVPFQPFLYFRF